jgi:hypothetical protein
MKCCIWSITLYGAETWTLRKLDQKYLKSFETRCCRRMERINRTDCVKNSVVLHRVKEKSNCSTYHEKRRITELVSSLLTSAF